MLESLGRPLYQKIFVDRVPAFLSEKITPNTITVLAGISGIAIIPLLLWQHHYWAIACLWLSGYLDTLDGTLARYRGQSSQFGTALDIATDRVVEFSVILGLLLVAPHARGLESVLMLGSILFCVTAFLVVGIFTPNASQKGFHYSAGLIERPEAFLFFTLMMFWTHAFEITAIIFTVLVFYTGAQHIYQFYCHEKQNHTAKMLDDDRENHSKQ